jgi:NADH:ubiquinone oxidoreductase subunit 4 (subunit M)
MLASLAFLVIFFGFYPAPLIDTMSISIDNLISNYQIDLALNTVQNK